MAENVVKRLLNETHFDVRQHPELYEPTGTDRKGRQIFRACAWCEKEYGADKKYAPDVAVSHGYCRRHTIGVYVKELHLTPEQAAEKIRCDTPPDWQEALGPAPSQDGEAVAPAAKATFWPTSGGLA